MSEHKYSADSLLQAIEDYESECPDQFAGLGALLRSRASEIDAARQPAPAHSAASEANDAARALVVKWRTMKLGKSLIGPLHGAGMSDGFRFAADELEAALSTGANAGAPSIEPTKESP